MWVGCAYGGSAMAVWSGVIPSHSGVDRIARVWARLAALYRTTSARRGCADLPTAHNPAEQPSRQTVSRSIDQLFAAELNSSQADVLAHRQGRVPCASASVQISASPFPMPMWRTEPPRSSSRARTSIGQLKFALHASVRAAKRWGMGVDKTQRCWVVLVAAGDADEAAVLLCHVLQLVRHPDEVCPDLALRHITAHAP